MEEKIVICDLKPGIRRIFKESGNLERKKRLLTKADDGGEVSIPEYCRLCNSFSICYANLA